MNLVDLKKPFAADEIEWRIARSGKRNGQIWAKVLAYVTNRAIMDRLDEVCGQECWTNEYQSGPDGGVLCGISIRVNTEEGYVWLTKWDGADNTNIESTKGGLSGAMKRAAVQWGIGRYLYKLTEDWPEIVEKGGNYAKTKEGDVFYWLPPDLPSWALPEGASELPERPHTGLQSDFKPETEENVNKVFNPSDTPQKKALQDMSAEELYRKAEDGIIKMRELDINVEDDESRQTYLKGISGNRDQLIVFINSMARKINPPQQGELV
jgi:hypothetical protein